MRQENIDRKWSFNYGLYGGMAAIMGNDDSKEVNLPHDYMIETDVRREAPAGPASGYYTAGVAHYTKKIDIPAEWENQQIYLQFDGVMMNATVDVNGGKVALQHYGYAPFFVDITSFVYFGIANRVTITVNPSMQPNSRWYSGAGIFRSVSLVHTPKLHIAIDGIYAYTDRVENNDDGTQTAFLKTEIKIENHSLENKMALVEVYLTEDGNDNVIVSRKSKIQVNPNSSEVAYIPITVESPKLWDVDNPSLYQVHAVVTELGRFVTHQVEVDNCTVDKTQTLFGIRTISVDSKNGLRINGKSVKLKGGCLHHDNGILGAVSLYDSEYRKLSLLKEIGFNAVRTTHNPPSTAFMEACDRIGMYVFDEAFDAWGIMKQPGDYNMFFESDWQKDLSAFITRDRNHPSVIIWSIGNEIPERGGLNNGYTLATTLVKHVKSLDSSRPVSNGICSYWSGLDDELTEADLKKMQAMFSGETAGTQNMDFGSEDLSWENYSEAFTNGLDIVGYNYMEDKYPKNHELYPERVILGSENYPKEIGKRWPMVESSDYVIGDFTWTAYDYIGEAGIGKTAFVDENDPLRNIGSFGLMSHSSEFPWRLANDADIDINGNILPQGCYRSVVWGSTDTHLFVYNPANYGKYEVVSMWGFTDVQRRWNWDGYEGKPIALVVFSSADEVEITVNGESIGRKSKGEALAVENLPHSFVFDTVFEPGEICAISYSNGRQISKDTIFTTKPAAQIVLRPERNSVFADGHSLIYIPIEIVDEDGNIGTNQDYHLKTELSGEAELLGFGSANPITLENYTSGEFDSYRGRALAVLRAGYEKGIIHLNIVADGLKSASIDVKVE